MKNYIYSFSILLLFFSCKNEPKNNVEQINNETSTEVSDIAIEKKEKIKRRLEVKYVTAESGLNVRDVAGKKIGKLAFNDAVIIKDYSDDYISVEEEGQTIKGRKAEIKYNGGLGYVFEGFLSSVRAANEADFMRLHNDFRAINHPDVRIVEEVLLDTIVKFEKITKEAFDGFSIYTNDHIERFPPVKQDHVALEMLDGSTKVLQNNEGSNDGDYEGEGKVEYQLVGDLEELNYYLISANYIEDFGYEMHSKRNENEVLYLNEFPQISPGMKQMVTIYNGYDSPLARMMIYNINLKDQMVDLKYSVGFERFGFDASEKDFFWISENQFIMMIYPVNEYHESDKNPSYIKGTLY